MPWASGCSGPPHSLWDPSLPLVGSVASRKPHTPHPSPNDAASGSRALALGAGATLGCTVPVVVLLCSQKKAILTTIGVLEEPLGNARLHGARLMAALLHTNTPSINQELCRLNTMGLLLVSGHCCQPPLPHLSTYLAGSVAVGRCCRAGPLDRQLDLSTRMRICPRGGSGLVLKQAVCRRNLFLDPPHA